MAEVLYDIEGVPVPPGTDGMTEDELLQAWRDEDARVLAEHDGDADAANRALGLDNMAAKMRDQDETEAFLAEHPEAVRMQEEIGAMDPEDRAERYPTVPDEN